MQDKEKSGKIAGLNRREFIRAGLAVGALSFSGSFLYKNVAEYIRKNESRKVEYTSFNTFIGRAASYNEDLSSIVTRGLKELKVGPEEIKGKRILLKPNLVETHLGSAHINTHPMVVRGAIDAFLSLGASSVIVAEGAGHCRDTILILEESGMGEVLYSEKVPFVDLNNSECFKVENKAKISKLPAFSFPSLLRSVDWVVSMGKMKTHHWVGVTLSMKNLFGIMPGSVYGWPKNVLHWAGIEHCIIDINTIVRPHLSIVDGVIGMEGDGPIMGDPKRAGVIVMGRNSVAVDATCARIMGIDPEKVNYLGFASLSLGPIEESRIGQCGENINSVKSPFRLIDSIPAQKKMMEI